MKRLVRLRTALQSKQGTPVPLPVAASLVHFQVHLQVGAPRVNGELDRELDDAATALAQVADVYYESPDHLVVRIPGEELRNGGFRYGAKEFVTPGGAVYCGLSLRRVDFMKALEALQEARHALSRAGRMRSRFNT